MCVVELWTGRRVADGLASGWVDRWNLSIRVWKNAFRKNRADRVWKNAICDLLLLLLGCPAEGVGGPWKGLDTPTRGQRIDAD